MSTTPRLSLVIPTWNGRDLLARFLPSVLVEMRRMGDCELVVSDDGSTDDTTAWLARHCPEARCVASPLNRGFAPAANAGIAAAAAPLAVLLNNDLELTPGCLDPLPGWFDDPAIFGVTLRGFDLPDRVFSTGGKLGRFRRGFWEAWRNYENAAEARPESFMLVGGFCAFRRQAFLELGGFDPVFAPYYSEDLDLSYRARKRGWQLGYEPRSVVLHAPSSTVHRHRGRFRRQVVIERNRLLFHWRNLDSGWLGQHLFWAHLLLLQMALKGNLAYHLGFAQALARLPQVHRFRCSERPRWVCRDRELELAFWPQPVTAAKASALAEPQ